ncbi:MAG: S1-like domain-containing RNA-binding protein [Verrucomicrobiales bacterium]|jgi:predicted RNA-binding protein (virulence factor B family)|nr:S1-like domain-containing RNA-binding protein [Verrucomicrobiales bacterium]
MAQLGKTNTLLIVRDSDFGFYLDGGELGEILLPNAEVPQGVEQGDELEVFVSRDSEDRIVATVQKPVVEVGQFAALEVTAVNSNIGAFLDWGLSKDLLLPFREQPFHVRVGQLAVVYVMIDEVSNRIVATLKTNRFLDKTRADYQVGEPVSFIIQERTPLGYMAIVNQAHRGLLHESRISRPLKIGETFDGYIAAMKEQGKIDLSLEPVGYGRVTDLSGQIMEKLGQNGGHLKVSDKSSPEEIRRMFQTSKKAFKQALGALYRKRLIEMKDGGISLLKKSDD